MEAALPAWFEITSFVVLLLILAADLVLAYKRPHIPSTRESALWVSFYVVLALIFAGLMLWQGSVDHAAEFIAGWVTEYSLSIDNLFVFVIIMARFSVPRKYQQEILMVGIIIALVLRGIFILLGAQLIENFSWIFYIFGAFLLWTAWTLAKDTEHDDDGENGVVRFARRFFNTKDEWHGLKLFIKENNKTYITPMFLVILALGTTDLLFALDSIPAIYGLTREPYLVFTANVFALMGLRQLYFLLGDLLKKLIYLSQGLAVLLAFIGVKLVLHALHTNELPFINGGEHFDVPEIPTLLSLGVIVGILSVTAVVSLTVSSRRERDTQS